jgi:hypothetical protein
MKNRIAFLVLAGSFVLVGTTHAAESAQEPVAVGGFVDLEWRMMAVGGHLSHGPGFAAGVSFFDGALRLGLAGISVAR